MQHFDGGIEPMTAGSPPLIRLGHVSRIIVSTRQTEANELIHARLVVKAVEPSVKAKVREPRDYREILFILPDYVGPSFRIHELCFGWPGIVRFAIQGQRVGIGPVGRVLAGAGLESHRDKNVTVVLDRPAVAGYVPMGEQSLYVSRSGRPRQRAGHNA